MREIETPAELDAWLSDPGRPPAAVQALDLTAHAGALAAGGFRGSLFLGCTLDAKTAGHLVATGAVVLPHVGGVRFRTHRSGLYTPRELFGDFDPDDPEAHLRTLDHRIYEEFVAQGAHAAPSIEVTLARRLHDHAITDALQEALAGRQVVAIMGGHGTERGEPTYAAVARIARTLTRRGFLMISGGGPGAMEATHLGAYLANLDEDGALGQALAILTPRPAGATPREEYRDPDWLHRAMRVREALPLPDRPRFDSIGIPTWHYGHEPPAAFASLIAKYFANSVREEGLLAVASHGVIFSPGSAGTTQEIFQDAAQNHYRSFGPPAPMVLFGVDHWTRVRPVWPLLVTIAAGHDYRALLALTDDEDEVVGRIAAYEPAE
ncbi:MAG: LOG family protein [Sandaracinaceae bacterium]